MRHNWLIVGADGGIGSALAQRLPDATRTTRRAASGNALSLDLAADPEAWQLPDSVSAAFLTAARCSIDDCRSYPVETRLVNVERTVRLAEELTARGTFVVLLSTNQVFDGSVPFRKAGDVTCPITEYGRQKADVERAILGLGGAVVRLTKVFAGIPPLLRTWAESIRDGRAIEPFADMVFSPVPMATVVEALVACGERREPGIVQVSGDCDISYAEAAMRLASRLGASSGLVRPASAAARGIDPASIPRHTTLDTPIAPAVSATLDGLFAGLVARSVSNAA